MEKIKLVEVFPEELDMIVEALDALYQRKLKKVQRHRNPKMVESLRICQTILQEMLASVHYAKQQKEADNADGPSILR
jgi:hypothetical protein